MDSEDSRLQGAPGPRREPSQVPGQHTWVMAVVLSCPDPDAALTSRSLHISSANFVSADGPLCYFCGHTYSNLEAAICPGAAEVRPHQVT